MDIEGVYREFGTRCYSLALRVVRDHDLARDVVQDVFESLARSSRTFDASRGSLSTWLMTVTHHKAVDLLRWRNSRARFDVSDALLSEVAALAACPAEKACISEERSRVVAALLTLRYEERQVLLLAYFGGYTQREIAELTGVPLGTIKSRTVAGMTRMRDQLGASSL